MKVTDLRRKLIEALAAGGLLVSGTQPATVRAAELNTNLISNSGFEAVTDTLTLGAYNTPMINDWTPLTPDKAGFAYSHNGSLSAGFVVPNYANGAPLASGGNWYFSPNAGPNGAVINGPGQLYQDIDVSAGPSGTLIAGGSAAFRASGFFNSYIDQGDIGHLHLNFLNAAQASLGTAEVAGVLPLNEWQFNSRGGVIPAGTKTVRVSIYGTTPVGGGPDGYMDNVEFLVTNEVIQPVLSITVNRDTGGITLTNQTGNPVNVSGYSISSAFEGLAPANWLSIAENYDAGNPGPNQVDAAHQWSELTDPNVHGDLSEADLQSGDGAAITHNRSVNLGNGAWIQTPTEDLVFQYASNGQVVSGIVNYTGNGGQPFRLGDLNLDNAINSADWMIFRANQQGDLSNTSLAEAYRLGDLTGDQQNNHADFVLFKSAFDAANGAGSFALMAASVPEPNTVFLLLAAGLVVLPPARGRMRRAGAQIADR